jgi:hypothetical protein
MKYWGVKYLPSYQILNSSRELEVIRKALVIPSNFLIRQNRLDMTSEA